MRRRIRRTTPRPGGGLQRILIATVVAGAAGYLIQAIAGWGLTPAEYEGFGVFWAAFYLAVGAIAGVQQEIARASRVALPGERGTGRKLFVFAVVVAAAVGLLIAATGPFWAPAVFGDAWCSPLLALLVGAVGYVGFATVSGAFYGRESWGALALVIVSDPVLRVGSVSLVLFVGAGLLVPWAVVLPVLLTAAIALLLLVRARPRGTVVFEPIGRLLGNVVQTIGGSAATAVLISALPLFISLSAQDVDSDTVGAFIFNLTLTRAPLVIPVLALQGWLVVRFRGAGGALTRSALLMAGTIVGLGLVIGAVAWVAVPPVVGLVFGPDYVLDGGVSAAIVATASLTGALCATGALAVARSAHRAYLLGWVLAAGSSVALLFVPLAFESRVLLALTVGPLLGLAVHLGFFAAIDRRSTARGRDSAEEGVAE